MAAVRFARSAENDLLEAWLTIAEDNMAAADKMLQTIEQEATALARQPKMDRTRPGLGDAVRSWPTSTPYILYYLHCQTASPCFAPCTTRGIFSGRGAEQVNSWGMPGA